MNYLCPMFHADLPIWLSTTRGAALTICLFSAFLLRMQIPHIRSRNILAVLMLVWSGYYVLSLIAALVGRSTSELGILPPYTLIMGSSAVILMTFYVVEVVRPGWLSWQRGVLWFIPFLLVVVVYYITLGVTGESSMHLPDIQSLWDSSKLFNVWYRYVLLLVSIVYLGAMFYIFLHYSTSYRHWVENYYSNKNNKDISWIWVYCIGLLCMTVIYFYGLLTGEPSSFVVHYLIIVFFFAYIVYKALFHTNPYPEGYFHITMDEAKAEKEFAPPCDEASEYSFTARMDEYKATLEEWMRTEKPFLRPDFKLLDVSAKLPMNRTYLSRLFNEGYGTSFSQVVRRYRIEEAQRLMEQQPQMRQKDLWQQCGFTSRTVFHRAFIEETGKKPKQGVA